MSGVEDLFGKAVRNRREALGISQERIAELAGIHRTYVSRVELGRVQVGIGVAWRIALALEVRLSELFVVIEAGGLSDPSGEP